MAVKKATTRDDIKRAEPVEEGYVRVTSPAGIDTTVPESIVEALVDSGYKRK